MRHRGMPQIREGGVNVTPLIDIVMCMIIFFMLVAKIGVATGAEEQIDIPVSTLGKDIKDIGIESALILNIREVSNVPMITALVEPDGSVSKTGQPVELKSDIYGGKVVYHGRVAGFSGGTGSAFSLIPAQNATGNWIKVVQRLPVRIQLDPKELAAHPLRVGLSMEAEIDVSGQE